MDYLITDIKSNQAGKYGKACIDFILNPSYATGGAEGAEMLAFTFPHVRDDLENHFLGEMK